MLVLFLFGGMYLIYLYVLSILRSIKLTSLNLPCSLIIAIGIAFLKDESLDASNTPNT